jgi:light-harvesting protein B-800-850 alpha chain
MIFGQAVSVQAEDVIIEGTSVSSEEAAAPVEEAAAAPVEEAAAAPVEEAAAAPVEEAAAAPVEEAAAAPVEEAATPVEEAAAPVEETTTPADEIETVGTVTTIAVDSMYDEYATQTTAVALAVEGTTTTVPYLDTTIYNAVDVNSDAGKAQVADKSIDYDKVYNDFLYNVVVPNTEGGISSTSESGRPQEIIDVESVSGNDGIRVYSEMLGIFAATVHDFCNDSIPELIVVTNSLVDEERPTDIEDSMNYPSRVTYDIWQYNKADDSIKKVSTTDSMYPMHITSDGIFEVGNEKLNVSLAGDTILEEIYVDSRGDSSRKHGYTMYKINDDYSFSSPYTIGASWFMESETKKAGGNVAGYSGYGLGQKFTSVEDVKAAFKAYGIDADVTASFGESDADVSISNVKNQTKLYDYKATPGRDCVNFELTDYTGVHGKTSSAPASTNGKTGNESAKAANKNDSPKTGVAFPIAAAGTGAAALALAAAAVVSKKKKD